MYAQSIHGQLLGLESLDALALDIEIQLQAGEIAIWKIGEAWVPERIVLLEQHENGEIALVAEYTRHVEPRIRCAPERGGSAVGIEALQVHRAMRLELE